MNDEKLITIGQVKQFLKGSDTLRFEGISIEERYRWIESALVRFKYHQLKRAEKGVIRQYLQKMSGYSRAQVCRLIRQYYRHGRLRKTDCKRHRFPVKYTLADIVLLAKTDELRGYLSGPATKKIMEQEWAVYGHMEFRTISQISVAHLYNLRRSYLYRNLNKRYTRTKPAVVNIAERARPNPEGKQGYIRVDTVHQGDRGTVRRECITSMPWTRLPNERF